MNQLKLSDRYRLTCKIRNQLRFALKNKGWKSTNKIASYIGCSYEGLIFYLESQFLPGMTWENRSEWDIDHVTPLREAKNEKEIFELAHYTNLCPMPRKDNVKKGAKMTDGRRIREIARKEICKKSF